MIFSLSPLVYIYIQVINYPLLSPKLYLTYYFIIPFINPLPLNYSLAKIVKYC